MQNKLEYYNELCLIVMQYMILFFALDFDITIEAQWQLGNVSIAVIIFSFALNLLPLLYNDFHGIKLKIKIEMKKRRYRANQVVPLVPIQETESNRLNEATILPAIMEEDREIK